MPEDETSEVQETDEEEVLPEDPTARIAALERQVKKANNEAHKLRIRAVRGDLAAKHGSEILELVPDDIPLARQEELAAKLAEKLATGAEGTAQPSVNDEVAVPAAPTPQEAAIAAVATPSGGNVAPSNPKMTLTEWFELFNQNPQAAMAMRPEQLDAEPVQSPTGVLGL